MEKKYLKDIITKLQFKLCNGKNICKSFIDNKLTLEYENNIKQQECNLI